MSSPEQMLSRGQSPAPSSQKSKTSLHPWRDRSDLSEKGQADLGSQREVSYAVGTRPALSGSASRGPLSQDCPRQALDLQRLRPPAGSDQALFDKLDTNHDGVLSRPEFAAGFGAAAAGGQSADVVLEPGERARSALGEGNMKLRMQELRKGAEEQDLQMVASHKEQEGSRGGSSLSGLAAERDRLQRQVQEMRGAVADTRRELTSQHEMQRLQTSELRSTLASLQSDADSLQREQWKQANVLKDRKGFAEADQHMSKKVDGVAAKVESQEQKFARLESDLGSACAAQRAQLAEALAQGRQLARNLEEEGARRAASVAELQQVLQQGQRKDGLLVSQLQQDLSRATQAIQGQSGDWMDLARTIKQEVAGLAGAMKADRDARAIESSSQRVELARMIDNARRANVCDTVETYMGGATSEYGQDMMSRAGAVAVRKMVDTTKALLHGLEEALILRAGFIAGIFHTWRCEATLWKVGRRYQEEFARNQDEWEAHLSHHRASFEEELRQAAEHHACHKERMQVQKAMMLDSWAYGESVALVRETLRCWHSFADQEQKDRRTAARIHTACLQWAEGNDKGMVDTCFKAWAHWMLVEEEAKKRDVHLGEAEKRHAQELDKEQKKAEQRIQEGLAHLAKAKDGFKQSLGVIVAKWGKGSRKGLLASVMRAWEKFWQFAKTKARRSQAVQLSLHRCMEGGKRGVKHWCFHCWRNELMNSRQVKSEKQRFSDLLSGDRADREREHKRELSKYQSKVEEAKQSVGLMVHKWSMGQDRGLMSQVFQSWATCTLKKVADARKCASVEMTVSKWAEGEKRGLIHGTFVHWKSHALSGALNKRHQALVQEETQKLRDFLQDKESQHQLEVESFKSEAARRKEAAKRTHDYIVYKWTKGDAKAALIQGLKLWHKIAKDAHRRGIHRGAVHRQLLSMLEGQDKASVQMSLLYWQGYVQCCRQERDQEDTIKREREHFDGVRRDMERLHEKALRGVTDKAEERRLKALALSESTLMKWMGGQRTGLLRTAFVDWRRCKDAATGRNARLAAVKTHFLRMLESEQQGQKHLLFVTWMNLAIATSCHRSRVDQLEKQVEGLISRQEIRLSKYVNLLGNEQKPVLKGWVFNMWKEVAQGVRYLEQERETEVKLEALKRKHDIEVTRRREVESGTLRAFGMKDDLLIVVQVFEAWKRHFLQVKQEFAERVNNKKVLAQYAEGMIMQRLTQDAASLTASCFAEWHRAAMILKHQNYQDDLHRRIEEHGLYASQMEQRVAGLEEQLMTAYRQIDHITDTLQKELQTKEELTTELREAYDKMRKSFTPTAITPISAANTTAGDGAFSSWPLRPGSARSQSAGSAPGSRSARPSGGGFAGKSDQDGHSLRSLQDPLFDRGASSLSASLGASAVCHESSPGRCDLDGFVPRLRDESSFLRSSPHSTPPRCDWDVAVTRMRDEGYMRKLDVGSTRF